MRCLNYEKEIEMIFALLLVKSRGRDREEVKQLQFTLWEGR